jgi:hypothetical protein
VGSICKIRISIIADLNGVGHVKTELCKVSEIFKCELPVSQMGVDEPETLEAARMDPPSVQFWDGDASGITGDHILHRTRAIDEKADLDADLV